MDGNRDSSPGAPELSVVLPCFEEEGSLPALLAELHAVLAPLGRGYEIVCVDDASGDGTAAVVRRLAAGAPALRLLRHGRRSGQSAALASGLRAARGAILLTLDADGQNDPADLPALLAALAAGADAACGVRLQRHDSWVRRLSSRVGNGFRDVVTGVRVRDAGCALRALRRECLAELPVFNGLHRFLPTILRLQGFRVVEVPVGHRPRRAGVSKYGIANRLVRGVVDCLAMRWFAWRLVPVRRLLGEPGAPGATPDPAPDTLAAPARVASP
jgi:glycosyltransferase involved in cell wall biosynthesis